jgi:hypothetical protein
MAAWVAACLVLVPASAVRAQGSLELAVKAAYLLKFPLFVEWPRPASSAAATPFLLCVVGEDPFRGLLDEAASGQRVGGRPVVLRRLAWIVRESGCDMAYLTGSPAQSAAAALDAVRGTPVLTVTDAERYGGRTGIVNFIVQNNRVRFEIDDAAAAASGLVISSKLLSLAVAVRPRT